jgi:hypothetical protein
MIGEVERPEELQAQALLLLRRLRNALEGFGINTRPSSPDHP